MISVDGTTIADAWLRALERLAIAGGDAFSLVTCISTPTEPAGPDVAVRGALDALLLKRGLQDTQTVANTIFPVELARSRSIAQLSEVYLGRAWPVLRRVRQNQRGTYFLRMIERPACGQVSGQNPLDTLVAKIRTELSRGDRMIRSAYELAIYDPLRDSAVRMGFPCLSHVSVKIAPREHALHLMAIYRNQRFFERAFGNYLGLARLQAFIAKEVNLAVGTLVCHATHAEIDHLGKRDRRALISECQALLARSKLQLGAG